MALATYTALCIDAVDPTPMAAFWATALGLRREPGDVLRGSTPGHTVWINQVPEPKAVKSRVHIDVHAGDIAELTRAGAAVVPDQDFRWTVMTDLEGQEFCAFVREQPPVERLYEVVVDCADSASIAAWWGHVFGVEAATEEGKGWHWIGHVPGAPFDGFSFVPVPEPKTAKNRMHWDVEAETSSLLAAGAAMLLPRGGGHDWDVLADPDGNEFCAFAPSG